jgi:predicted phage terminase large subunit-like protein
MIFMPPRHGKSRTVSETFPSWFIGKNPDRRVIVVSYALSLARRFGRFNRYKFDEYCSEIFGVDLQKDSKMQSDWNVQGFDGGMVSAGIEGGVTGQGADCMIIDDPIKNREQAESETYREKAWDEWESTLKTRLHPGASVILILTRWHYEDLAGRLLNPEYGPVDDWEILKLPLLAEKNDLLNRLSGDPLWPEHGYDKQWADRIQASTSAGVFASLYQQRPVPDEGNIFKSEWWQYYNRAPIPEELFVIQSWDTGYKVDDLKKKNIKHSFSCGQTWGEYRTGYYLLDRYNRKLEYPDLKRAVISEYDKVRAAGYAVRAVLIEDKASGQSLAQELKRETKLPIISVPVKDGDKEQRAIMISPNMEARRVFLPGRAAWLNEYKDNMESFPNGDYSDDTDCTSQALNYLTQKRGRIISGATLMQATTNN